MAVSSPYNKSMYWYDEIIFTVGGTRPWECRSVTFNFTTSPDLWLHDQPDFVTLLLWDVPGTEAGTTTVRRGQAEEATAAIV